MLTAKIIIIYEIEGISLGKNWTIKQKLMEEIASRWDGNFGLLPQHSVVRVVVDSGG